MNTIVTPTTSTAILSDNYIVRGNNINEFRTALSELERHLKFVKTLSADIWVLSYRDFRDNKIFFYGFKPDEGTVAEHPSIPLNGFSYEYEVENVEEKEFLLRELAINKLCLFDGLREIFYFTSDHIKNDLVLIGMGGNAMTEPSVERDMLITKQFAKNRMFTLVTKNDKFGNKKVFGIRSGKYKPLPQNILVDVISEINKDNVMGKMDCREWEMSHFMTHLAVEFPEKAEEMFTLETESGKSTTKNLTKLTNIPVPGLRLITSDTGDSSVQVMGTWRVGNSYIITDTVSTRHSEKASVEGIVFECKKKIFDGFRNLPELLCKLSLLDVTNPDWDLTTMRGVADNQIAVNTFIDNIFEQLKIEKAIGKKRCAELLRLIQLSIDFSVYYSAYDIVMLLLEMPGRIQNLDNSIMERLAKALGNITRCNFDCDEMYII